MQRERMKRDTRLVASELVKGRAGWLVRKRMFCVYRYESHVVLHSHVTVASETVGSINYLRLLAALPAFSFFDFSLFTFRLVNSAIWVLTPAQSGKRVCQESRRGWGMCIVIGSLMYVVGWT